MLTALHLLFLQNIDMLDVLAGVSEDKMIECHGHFRTAACTKCSRTFDGNECKRIIVEEKEAPKCTHCGGYVKPDIVFFGGKCTLAVCTCITGYTTSNLFNSIKSESLPNRFHKLVKQDTKNADMLIVMGTCKCMQST